MEEYFAGEGRDEPVVLEIPKGSYAPVFELRGAAGSITGAHDPQPYRQRSYRWILVPTIILAISGALPLVRGRAPHSAEPAPLPPAPLSLVFDRSYPTDIVVADTCLVMLQDLLHSDIPLSEYINGEYPANVLSRIGDPKSAP